jgi:hypothetical protein
MKNWKKQLATALAKELVAVGFDKAKDARFTHVTSKSGIVVEVQQSSKSTETEGICTVNVGLWFLDIAREIGGPQELAGLSAMDCPWWIRAGQMHGGREQWWPMRAEGDGPNVATAIWQSFLSEALDVITPLLDPAEFKAKCLAGPLPFLDDIARWMYVVTLARSDGDALAVKKGVDELRLIAAKRTLPISAKQLLSSG